MKKISAREIMLWVGILGAAGMLAWSSTQGHNHDHQVGKPAPALAARDQDGQVVEVDKLRGQTVVLNFYANWCPPCRKEIPDLAAFHQEVDAKGLPVKVYGVLLESGPPQEALPATRKLGVTYPVLLGSPSAAQLFEIHTFPTTVVVGPDGTLVARHEGVVNQAFLRDLVARARP